MSLKKNLFLYNYCWKYLPKLGFLFFFFTQNLNQPPQNLIPAQNWCLNVIGLGFLLLALLWDPSLDISNLKSAAGRIGEGGSDMSSSFYWNKEEKIFSKEKEYPKFHFIFLFFFSHLNLPLGVNLFPRFCWAWGYLSKTWIPSLPSFPSPNFQGLFLLPHKELMWVFPFYLSCLKVNKISFPISLPSVKYSVWHFGVFWEILGRNISDGIRDLLLVLKSIYPTLCCSESGIWGRFLVLKCLILVLV